jgi:hypothetical protein
MKPISASLLSLGATAALSTPALAQCAMDEVYASNGKAYDWFGAAIAVDDGQLLVSADGNDFKGSKAGTVYMYGQNGSEWSQINQFWSPDAAAGDLFGKSLAFSGDDFVVGAWGDDDNGSYSGSIYVYNIGTGVWDSIQKLKASDGAADDYFGFDVDLADDVIVVGAYGDDDNGDKTGAAYVFELVGGAWTQTAKLTASDGAGKDYFGWAVAIYGETIAVGAWGDDDFGSASGSAYVFEKVGGAWTETAKLNAPDTSGLDYFGKAIQADEDRVFVGAAEDDDAGASSGSVHVFERVGGTWTHVSKLVASDAMAGDNFGFSISSDAGQLVVGATGVDTPGADAGAAYYFEEVGGVFVETSKVQAYNTTAGDTFGFSVSLRDGAMAVGARNALGSAIESGLGHVFSVSAQGCPTLGGSPFYIPLAEGGYHNLFLNPGAAHAGELYLVLGSASGTSPGIPTTGGTVPLNPDLYFTYMLSNPNQGVFSGTFGTIDPWGTALATINLPQGTNPGLAGMLLNHAFVTIDPVTAAVEHVSNSTTLELVP